MRRIFLRRKKWRNPWFVALPPICKLVIEYLRAHCDAAGIWDFDRSDIELKVGMASNQRAWIHPQIRGIEYATEELAIEDAEARGLKGDNVRHKEIARWASIIKDINRQPPKCIGEPIPVLEIIGENKWWFVKLIEEEYGTGDERYTGRIELDYRRQSHSRVLRLLNQNALLARFKIYYPSAIITESKDAAGAPLDTAAITAQIDAKIPSMEQILDAPEGGRLPASERRMFWLDYNHIAWEGIEDWRALLAAEEAEWAVRFDYSQITGNPWPETKRERHNAIAGIEQRIADENANRADIGGELRLTQTGRQNIKALTAARNLIKKR